MPFSVGGLGTPSEATDGLPDNFKLALSNQFKLVADAASSVECRAVSVSILPVSRARKLPMGRC